MVLHGSPWLYTYSHCHQMITQKRPKHPWGLSKVTLKSQFFNLPMLARIQLSTHQWGPILESWRPGTPSLVRGSI